jgi:hypothetical protein
MHLPLPALLILPLLPALPNLSLPGGEPGVTMTTMISLPLDL